MPKVRAVHSAAVMKKVDVISNVFKKTPKGIHEPCKNEAGLGEWEVSDIIQTPRDSKSSSSNVKLPYSSLMVVVVVV